MMAALLAIGLGVMTAGGIYLMLRARTFDLILGLTLLGYAVNLFIFLTGRIAIDAAPILDENLPPTLQAYADPLPQALVLTAIVIGFAMTAVIMVIALLTRARTGSDHVDGVEPDHAIHAGTVAGMQEVVDAMIGQSRANAPDDSVDEPPRSADVRPEKSGGPR